MWNKCENSRQAEIQLWATQVPAAVIEAAIATVFVIVSCRCDYSCSGSCNHICHYSCECCCHINFNCSCHVSCQWFSDFAVFSLPGASLLVAVFHKLSLYLSVSGNPGLWLVRILWLLCKFQNISNASPTPTLLHGGGHISDTINHRPLVLYIFGILGSRPPPSCIQITIWAPHGPPDGEPPYGLAL